MADQETAATETVAPQLSVEERLTKLEASFEALVTELHRHVALRLPQPTEPAAAEAEE